MPRTDTSTAVTLLFEKLEIPESTWKEKNDLIGKRFARY